MKLKHRSADFRVTELLEEGVLREGGPHSVYRVTKRKVSTDEAARVLAELVGVAPRDVGIAGLKDRQGITTQHMSVPSRRRERLDRRDLRIEHVGFCEHALDSKLSRGNAFHITVRAIDARELVILRRNMASVREHGVPNYFDDQRFGNLRHEQGWIARDLMQGRAEHALRQLIASPSPFDDARRRKFKTALGRHWGDWRACRDDAGRFGSHHSVFEHLNANPGDFAGAFKHVSRGLRLIHLYAYQSHVWNRALAQRMRELVPVATRVVVDSVEGPLVCFEGAPPRELGETLRLPGPGLEDVADEADRAALADVLAAEGLSPDAFRIDGITGFQLKGEDRAVLVQPRHLRVRPAEPDPDHPGLSSVVLRFELPRGAYASLVVRRLFARSPEHRREDEHRPPPEDGPREKAREGRPARGRGRGYRAREGRGEDDRQRGGRRGGARPAHGAAGRGGGRRPGGPHDPHHSGSAQPGPGGPRGGAGGKHGERRHGGSGGSRSRAGGGHSGGHGGRPAKGHGGKGVKRERSGR